MSGETKRFLPLNSGAWAGVIDLDQGSAWVVEPEYSWVVATKMAAALEENPDLDPDVLTQIAEAG